MNEFLSEKNIDKAMAYLDQKSDSCGCDGVYLSELQDYWEVNGEEILEELRADKFQPGVVRSVEIINYKGKKRKIALHNSIDRLILRALLQILDPIIEKALNENCYAFRKGRGLLSAVSAIHDFFSEGYWWVCNIDIKEYFDSIPAALLEKRLEEVVPDQRILSLIHRYLHPEVESDGKIRRKKKGLLQGSPLSPMLSNYYLTALDKKYYEAGIRYCRYSDDITLYFKTREEAEAAYSAIAEDLKAFSLQINKQKSSVMNGKGQVILGYRFTQGKNGSVTAVQFKRGGQTQHNNWNESSIRKQDNQYHIINNGILSRKDFTILFENERGKKYLPAETTQNLNVYSNAVFSSGFFNFISSRNVDMTIFNKYGHMIGRFSANKSTAGNVMMKQAALYLDSEKRLAMAKAIENAIAHNHRAILKYYKKRKQSGLLEETIEFFTGEMKKINEAKDVRELLLIEARMKQCYYQAFNEIIQNDDFTFAQRTKRPPTDPLNALISFGNTYLYNQIATEINKTLLDIRIGIVHSTNRRSQTLNLDIADIFKPVLIDRTIFSLINRRVFDINRDFQNIKPKGVYLSKSGKRLFLTALYETMNRQIRTKKGSFSYHSMIGREVAKIYRAVNYGNKYKPYKYY